MGSHFVAVGVIGHHDPADPLAHVLQVVGDRHDRHDFAGHGDVEPRVHLEPVHLAAFADGDAAQRLRAEVDRPAHLDAVGVHAETAQSELAQLGVVIVGLVLHAGGQGDHRQVVGIGHRVDIARQADGKRGERDALRQAAAGRAALDVEGRPAAGLADRADGALADLAEPFHQAQRGRGLAFAERGGRDGRHIDVLGLRRIAQPVQDF